MCETASYWWDMPTDSVSAFLSPESSMRLHTSFGFDLPSSSALPPSPPGSDSDYHATVQPFQLSQHLDGSFPCPADDSLLSLSPPVASPPLFLESLPSPIDDVRLDQSPPSPPPEKARRQAAGGTATRRSSTASSSAASSAPDSPKLRSTKRARRPAAAPRRAAGSEEQRRIKNNNHNLVEKRYREHLNLKFERLLAVLLATAGPADECIPEEGRALSKGAVLELARRTVQDLASEKRKLAQQVEMLRRGRGEGLEIGDGFGW